MQRTPQRIATELYVLEMQAGKRSGFEPLYAQWTPILLAHCRRQLNQRADAQDAVQQVWIKALRGIGALKDPACFAAWILRIAHVTCVDIIRRSSRSQAVYAELSQQPEAEQPSPTQPEHMDLRRAIRELPTQQQDILSLHYTYGFSMGEIAHVLGIPAGTVKSRLSTARTVLASILEKGEHHE
ncbi:MAG: RNA polymerase sigma factor [Robiginitomaculum sp.]|nr:RNA polymerase sigma factor [Robiginitomaculum sp.]